MRSDTEIQKIQNIWRKSLLQFVAVDYIILDSLNKIRLDQPLTVATSSLNVIEDPYWVDKGPIINLLGGTPPNITTATTLPTLFDEFNDGNITKSMVDNIRNFDYLSYTQSDENNTLYRIKYYLNYRISIVLQNLLSYVLLYPDILYDLQKTDNLTKSDVVISEVKKYTDNPRQFEIARTVLNLINAFGSILDSPNEESLKALLYTSDWDTLSIVQSQPQSGLPRTRDGRPALVDRVGGNGPAVARKQAGLEDIYKDLTKLVELDLTTGRQPSFTGINHLVQVNTGLEFINIIVDIWKKIFNSRINSTMVLDFLVNELPRIYEYFEKSKSGPNMEQYIALAKNTLKTYLGGIFEDLDRLRDVISNASTESAIATFASLQKSQSSSNTNKPKEEHIKFLYSCWWILNESPFLSELHNLAESYNNVNDPNVIARISNSTSIFPDIVEKPSIATSSSNATNLISLERMYNERKKNSGELNRELLLPDRLAQLLVKVRGIPI